MLRFVLAASVGAQKLEYPCWFNRGLNGYASDLTCKFFGPDFESFDRDEYFGWGESPDAPGNGVFPFNYNYSRWKKLHKSALKQLIELGEDIQSLKGTDVKLSHRSGACKLELFEDQTWDESVFGKLGDKDHNGKYGKRIWAAQLTCDIFEKIMPALDWRRNCLYYGQKQGCKKKVFTSNMGPIKGEFRKCKKAVCQHILKHREVPKQVKKQFRKALARKNAQGSRKAGKARKPMFSP